MIAWLVWAAISAHGVQVDAGTLVVADDGRWIATDKVQIRYKGAVYHADKASYVPVSGEITLAGNVRSTHRNVRIECEQLLVGSGQVVAEQARVALLRGDGELLAELRAQQVIREGVDARFNTVDFSLCNCSDRPWSIGARTVEVVGEARRVHFSMPVFRVREVPVLALPWWSMPLKRRATGILPPLLGYDARDGMRIRLPFFWAPQRWWDLSLEPGFIDGRGPWSRAEFRMRPDAATRLVTRIESLHGLGLVDDQRIIGLDYSMHRPGLDWIHQGTFPSDSLVMGILSTDPKARVWRLADSHHFVRMGSQRVGVLLQGWSGHRTMAGEGGESDSSLSLRTILQELRAWGGATLEFALAPLPALQIEQPIPLVDGRLEFGHRWAPYLGMTTSLATRSAFFVSSQAHQPINRAAARLEAYSVLNNGRGTQLRPRLSLRTQWVSEVTQRASAALMGVSGRVFAVGLKAKQAGFVHDYEVVAFRRGTSLNLTQSGLLVSWNGVWTRKYWTLNGRLLFDTLYLEPALFTTSYTWRAKRPGSSVTAGFLRRHVGRDFTIDPDPWLLVNQESYADRLSSEGIYALLWGTARAAAKHWNLSLTGAVRPAGLSREDFKPLPWSLNSLRLDAGYSSRCKCWGLAAFGGVSGELRPGELSATPFVGLSFNAGRASPLALRQGALGFGQMGGPQ